MEDSEVVFFSIYFLSSILYFEEVWMTQSEKLDTSLVKDVSDSMNREFDSKYKAPQ